MSKIEIKFDNNIKQDEIIVQLTNSSPTEAGNNYKNNQQEIQQTSIYGIQAPLIKINNVVVDFIDVIEFSLKSQDVLPTVNITIKDRYNLISSLDTPGSDNILRVQILPRFDNSYKKINLTFYISQIRINKDYITLSGVYKLPKLTSSNIKAFGEIGTYNLFESIAKETELGFASNIDLIETDKRYIYCDNKSYLELMNREIKFSEIGDMGILEYWIDYWNTLTLVDIYERYNTIEKDENMLIWVSGAVEEIGEGLKQTPIQTTALLSNSPTLSNSELYIMNYNIINRTGEQYYKGTDKLYSIYSEDNKEYMDYLIQDGDVKKDIFTKYEYLGEYYGKFNYLLSERKRQDFLQKINTESLEIELKTPLLALMRGNKVNIAIYKNDPMMEYSMDSLKETNNINSNFQTYIPMDDDNNTKDADGKFILDKNISGQYMISGCNIRFYNNQWHYLITLNRPASNKTQIINE